MDFSLAVIYIYAMQAGKSTQLQDAFHGIIIFMSNAIKSSREYDISDYPRLILIQCYTIYFKTYIYTVLKARDKIMVKAKSQRLKSGPFHTL